MGGIIELKDVEKRIINIRGQQVLIDRDVADLYGVSTKEINQAAKNNRSKFPEGYTVVLSNEDKAELVKNFDRFNSLKHSAALPTAFTEKGLYMLATILKSPNATQTTIAIIETYSKIRELTVTISQLPDIVEERQQKSLLQRSGEILSDILDEHDLKVSGDETTIEVNFAVMKIKHTIKRKKPK